MACEETCAKSGPKACSLHPPRWGQLLGPMGFAWTNCWGHLGCEGCASHSVQPILPTGKLRLGEGRARTRGPHGPTTCAFQLPGTAVCRPSHPPGCALSVQDSEQFHAHLAFRGHLCARVFTGQALSPAERGQMLAEVWVGEGRPPWWPDVLHV